MAPAFCIREDISDLSRQRNDKLELKDIVSLLAILP